MRIKLLIKQDLKFKKLSFLVFLMCVIFISVTCDKEISRSPVEPPVGEAKVIVNSIPEGFTVYLNGRNTGKITPDSIIYLDEGVYELTLKKNYFKDTTLSVQLNKDESKSVFFDILSNKSMYGSLALISSPQGAQILINDSLVGRTTPDTLNSILPGEYNVTFKKFNYRDISFNAQVHSSQIRTFSRELRDTSAWVDYRESNSGIQSDFLSSIAVDNQNIKWIGTYNKGVIRYNDSGFINYNISNSPLISNNINCITVDYQNKIWIGTDFGAVVFDGIGWIFYNQGNSGLESDIINSIKFDNTGNIWFATSSGLYKFDGINWKRYFLPNDIFWVEDFVFSDDNKIWIGTAYNGIYFLENETIVKFPKSVNSYPTYSISSAAKNLNNQIWFCFLPDSSGTGGAAYWNGTNFINFLASSNLISYKHILTDNSEHKWISTNSGLIRYNNQNNFTIFTKSNSLISSNEVTASARDLSGNVWITTNGGGLNKYKPPQ